MTTCNADDTAKRVTASRAHGLGAAVVDVAYVGAISAVCAVGDETTAAAAAAAATSIAARIRGTFRHWGAVGAHGIITAKRAAEGGRTYIHTANRPPWVLLSALKPLGITSTAAAATAAATATGSPGVLVVVPRVSKSLPPSPEPWSVPKAPAAWNSFGISPSVAQALA